MSKKVLSLFLSVIMLISAAPTAAYAAPAVLEKGTYDKVEYVLYDDGRLVLSGSGGIYGIMDIMCFDSRVKSLYIGKDIGEIEHFSETAEEINVEAGNAYYSSENGVLLSADKQTLILYPRAKQDESYVMPATVKNIAEDAFGYGDFIKKLELSPAVEIFNYNGSSLKNLVIPENSVLKSASVFNYGQNTLEGDLFIPSGFNGIENLVDIEYSNKLTSIRVHKDNPYYAEENGAVYNKEKTELIFYPGLKADSVLTTPETLKTINMNKLDNQNIKTLNVSAAVESVILPEHISFGLEEINVNPGNKNYSSENGVLFNKDKTEILLYPEHKKGSEYVIPDSVALIGDSCFCYNENINKVTLPEGLKTIGADAFSNCTFLKEIFIPSSVENIGNYAFGACFCLENAVFAENIKIKSAGYVIFATCGLLRSVNLSAGVFKEDTLIQCSALEEINIAADDINYCSENGVVFNKDKTILINYPMGKKDKSYTVPETVRELAPGAFGSNYNLTSVTLPEGLETIGSSAFNGCRYLTSVNLPESIKTIGDRAFYRCHSLKNINLPASLQSLGTDNFFGCEKLEAINVDPANTVYTSVDGVLYNKDMTDLLAYPENSSKTSLFIPASVKNIIKDEYYYILTAPRLEEISVDPANTEFLSENGVLFNKDKTELIKYPQGKKDKVYNIPSGVTSGSNIYDCPYLTELNVPAGTGSIKSFNCRALQNINVDPLNEYLYSENGVLYSRWDNSLISYPAGKKDKSFTIPSYVTDSENKAFNGCVYLENLNIAGGEFFSYVELKDCTALKNINADPSNKRYFSYDGVLFDKNEYKSIVKYPGGRTDKSYTVPEFVKFIHSDAFTDCVNLEELYIYAPLSFSLAAIELTEQVYPQTVIHGYKGSYSEVYANSQRLKFVPVDKNCTLELVPAKEASCTEDGNIEYYKCTDCLKIFADKEGKNEITLSDTVIPAKGHSYEAKPGENTVIYTCKVCGASYEKPLPETEKRPGYPATCTKPGLADSYYCKEDGKVYFDRFCLVEVLSENDLIIEPSEHDFDCKIIDDKYLKKAGDIFHRPVYYYACEYCGAPSPDKTFKYFPGLEYDDTIEDDDSFAERFEKYIYKIKRYIQVFCYMFGEAMDKVLGD